jgi:hypothetical protein
MLIDFLPHKELQSVKFLAGIESEKEVLFFS